MSSSWRAGRRPVHPTEVVADDVGTQRVEVLAEPAERVGVLGARVRVAPMRLGQRPNRVQLRVDGEIGRGRRRGGHGRETEGVGDLHGERADRDHAALGGRQAVRGAGAAARSERREMQQGAARPGDRVTQA